jgi:hypothetical protein
MCSIRRDQRSKNSVCLRQRLQNVLIGALAFGLIIG